MSDDENQITLPPSFVSLFVPPGRVKPTASREHITQRYELCEDLAQLLVETAQMQRWSLGITTTDALQRIERGLPDTGLNLTDAESNWIMTRLAELLGPAE